jgi:pentose-5-phosphate-3-epimerase
MKSYRVVYFMPNVDHVFVMSVQAWNGGDAELETVKRLRQKCGKGRWAYEIYPIDGRIDGVTDTSVKLEA